MPVCGAVNNFATTDYQNWAECISATSRNSKKAIGYQSISFYLFAQLSHCQNRAPLSVNYLTALQTFPSF
jgi:hypothetical protein